MTDVLDDLKIHARAAKKHLAAYEREMAQVYALLPLVRVEKDMGPKDLEAAMEGLLDRGTISRKTAAAAGTSRKAAPAES